MDQLQRTLRLGLRRWVWARSFLVPFFATSRALLIFTCTSFSFSDSPKHEGGGITLAWTVLRRRKRRQWSYQPHRRWRSHKTLAHWILLFIFSLSELGEVRNRPLGFVVLTYLFINWPLCFVLVCCTNVLQSKQIPLWLFRKVFTTAITTSVTLNTQTECQCSYYYVFHVFLSPIKFLFSCRTVQEAMREELAYGSTARLWLTRPGSTLKLHHHCTCRVTHYAAFTTTTLLPLYLILSSTWNCECGLVCFPLQTEYLKLKKEDNGWPDDPTNLSWPRPRQTDRQNIHQLVFQWSVE